MIGIVSPAWIPGIITQVTVRSAADINRLIHNEHANSAGHFHPGRDDVQRKIVGIQRRGLFIGLPTDIGIEIRLAESKVGGNVLVNACCRP